MEPYRQVVDLSRLENKLIYRAAISDGLLNIDKLVRQQRPALEDMLPGITFAAQVYRSLYPGPVTPPVLEWMKEFGVQV